MCTIFGSLRRSLKHTAPRDGRVCFAWNLATGEERACIIPDHMSYIYTMLAYEWLIVIPTMERKVLVWDYEKDTCRVLKLVAPGKPRAPLSVSYCLPFKDAVVCLFVDPCYCHAEKNGKYRRFLKTITLYSMKFSTVDGSLISHHQTSLQSNQDDDDPSKVDKIAVLHTRRSAAPVNHNAVEFFALLRSEKKPFPPQLDQDLARGQSYFWLHVCQYHARSDQLICQRNEYMVCCFKGLTSSIHSNIIKPWKDTTSVLTDIKFGGWRFGKYGTSRNRKDEEIGRAIVFVSDMCDISIIEDKLSVQWYDQLAFEKAQRSLYTSVSEVNGISIE